MEHLNYCRHMAKQLTAISQIPSADEETKLKATHLIDLAGAAQKFILPLGGVLLEDDELKALDGAEALRLPHPYVALEYPPKEGGAKMITFAREHQDSASIAVTPVFYTEANGCWTSFPTFYIPANPQNAIEGRHQGKAHLTFIAPTSVKDAASKQVCIDAASIVLAFLNALQCSNVHIARSEPRKASKKVKAALPFDTYHVLTIDVPGKAGERGGSSGPHRSPREHLRRGHIRRLADGRKIWVNATVVAAGRSSGKVTKDYRLRSMAPAVMVPQPGIEPGSTA